MLTQSSAKAVTTVFTRDARKSREDLHSWLKFLLSILPVEVSVGTIQLTLSMAIMRVTASVAFMQVLGWYFLLFAYV